MTAAESAALERLIAAAENHPAALMLSSSQRAEYIAEARRVSRDGLSRREAVKVSDALDTPGERSNVQTLLAALVSKADAALLLKWLLNAVQSALSTPAVVTPATPESPAAGIVPHSGPILYLPATCGWLNGGEDMGAILRWLATYRGRVGLNFEATGSTGNQGVRTMNCLGVYMEHCLTLAEVVRACAVAGVPAKIDAINSNDFGKGWAASWRDMPENRRRVLDIMGGIASDLMPFAGRCIVQPVSEDDSSMPRDLRVAAMGEWGKAGWPRNRLCMDGGIAETHTGELKPLNPPALASTDNGPAIERHFGRGVWTAHTPNVERCTAYARHYLARGVHVSLYHRADRLHLLEHRAAYDAIIKAATGWQASSPVAPPSPPTGTPGAASLSNVRPDARKWYVKWDNSPDVDAWPVVDGCTGWIVLDGVRVEKFRKGYGRQGQHLKNAYGHDEHALPGIAKGRVVRLHLQQIKDSKVRTNEVAFTVPWEGRP